MRIYTGPTVEEDFRNKISPPLQFNFTGDALATERFWVRSSSCAILRKGSLDQLASWTDSIAAMRLVVLFPGETVLVRSPGPCTIYSYQFVNLLTGGTTPILPTTLGTPLSGAGTRVGMEAHFANGEGPEVVRCGRWMYQQGADFRFIPQTANNPLLRSFFIPGSMISNSVPMVGSNPGYTGAGSGVGIADCSNNQLTNAASANLAAIVVGANQADMQIPVAIPFSLSRGGNGVNYFIAFYEAAGVATQGKVFTAPDPALIFNILWTTIAYGTTQGELIHGMAWLFAPNWIPGPGNLVWASAGLIGGMPTGVGNYGINLLQAVLTDVVPIGGSQSVTIGPLAA